MWRSGCRGRALRAPSVRGGRAQLDVAEVAHPVDRAQLVEHVVGDLVVDCQQHHGATTRSIPADLHRGDVDVVRAEDGPETADQTWEILVPDHKEAHLRDQGDAECTDADDAWLAEEDGAGRLEVTHPEPDHARVAARPRTGDALL